MLKDLRDEKVKKVKKLNTQYDELIKGIEDSLKLALVDDNVHIRSKFVDGFAIPVVVFDYVELVFINDKLIFIDAHGSYNSLMDECGIEDLLDILNNL
jgi:hypothetical protein|tara:strand:- start:10140 stop:10433 length:294 start_codon:yes stop_codon:yes gene_type:complete